MFSRLPEHLAPSWELWVRIPAGNLDLQCFQHWSAGVSHTLQHLRDGSQPGPSWISSWLPKMWFSTLSGLILTAFPRLSVQGKQNHALPLILRWLNCRSAPVLGYYHSAKFDLVSPAGVKRILVHAHSADVAAQFLVSSTRSTRARLCSIAWGI